MNRRAVLALALLLAPSPALAERLITLGEALEQALAANPTVGRAELARDSSEAAVRAANGVFDPNLSVGSTWSRRQQRGFFQGFPFKADSRAWDLSTGLSASLPTGTQVALNGSLDRNLSTFTTDFGVTTQTETQQDAYTARTDLSVSQQLLRGARLAFNLQQVSRARDGLTIAELTLERSRQEILAQTAQAYWTWVAQVEIAALQAEAVAVAEEALRVGALRVEDGDLAPVERTRLEAALVQARSAEIEGRIAARQAADALLLLLGDAPGADVLPATAVGEVPLLELDPASAVGVALAQNLDLAIARARVEGARRDHDLARHARLPSLTATASTGVGSQETTAGAALSGLAGDEAFPYVQVGGNLQVPLGNRAARAEVARTSASLLTLELDLAEAERAVRSQVELQVARLASARRKVELADLNVRLARETLAAEEALAASGRVIQKDVLEARSALEQARVEALRARMDVRAAQIELMRLQGGLEPRDPSLAR